MYTRTSLVIYDDMTLKVMKLDGLLYTYCPLAITRQKLAYLT